MLKALLFIEGVIEVNKRISKAAKGNKVGGADQRKKDRRPAVFLDRDGVLNRDCGYLFKASELEWIPGAKEAVKLFNQSGYYVFVVTNQSGVARGFYGEAEVLALHSFMQAALGESGAHIDDWRYCPYHPNGIVAPWNVDHHWRKPKPGMLNDLIACWPVAKEGSFLIGDKQTDIDAAIAAGLKGYLFEGANLLDAAKAILSERSA